jgi:hypothetical protein
MARLKEPTIIVKIHVDMKWSDVFKLFLLGMWAKRENRVIYKSYKVTIEDLIKKDNEKKSPFFYKA